MMGCALWALWMFVVMPCLIVLAWLIAFPLGLFLLALWVFALFGYRV